MADDKGVIDQIMGENWGLYHGDAVEVLPGIPSESIDFVLHSPPFSSLYIYSDSERDLGNCADMAEFCQHYQFVISELYRVTVPGRLCGIHVKDLPKYANEWGTTGLIDFPGACIQEFEATGWVFHSRVTIWKCPVLERERTNNNGLLHKTVKRDTSQVRQGMADYLLMFRKPPRPGDGLLSAKPIVRPQGFTRYVGTQTDLSNCEHPSKFARKSGTQSDKPLRLADGEGRRKGQEQRSISIWRRYAEPVWWDIDPTDVLNFKLAKGDKDARHICPLALGLIERAVDIWSLPGEVVLSPFAGIGSEGVGALRRGRKFVGIELKQEYVEWATRFLREEEARQRQRTLFDATEGPGIAESAAYYVVDEDDEGEC